MKYWFPNSDDSEFHQSDCDCLDRCCEEHEEKECSCNESWWRIKIPKGKLLCVSHGGIMEKDSRTCGNYPTLCSAQSEYSERQ